jgi:hypothetical protein
MAAKDVKCKCFKLVQNTEFPDTVFLCGKPLFSPPTGTAAVFTEGVTSTPGDIYSGDPLFVIISPGFPQK